MSLITHVQGNPDQRGNFENAAAFLLLPAPKFKNLTEGSQRISSFRSKNDSKKKPNNWEVWC